MVAVRSEAHLAMDTFAKLTAAERKPYLEENRHRSDLLHAAMLVERVDGVAVLVGSDRGKSTELVPNGAESAGRASLYR